MEEAKLVLSNAGKILLKEALGIFQFFSKSQLERMATRAAPQSHNTVSNCFADQGVLLAVKK